MSKEKHIHFDEAKKFVIEKGYCSCAELQIHFKIGYNSGGRLVDQLYDAGIISEFDGSKQRRVLISKEGYKLVKVPSPITDHHYTMEYLSKLIGKKIRHMAFGIEVEIKSVDKIIYYDEPDEKKIGMLSFKTSDDAYDFKINSTDLIPLIHGGYTYVDAKMGYQIKIIQ